MIMMELMSVRFGISGSDNGSGAGNPGRRQDQPPAALQALIFQPDWLFDPALGKTFSDCDVELGQGGAEYSDDRAVGSFCVRFIDPMA